MSQEAPAAAAPKKSRKLLFIIVAVVVLLGGGGGAYWMFAARPAGRCRAGCSQAGSRRPSSASTRSSSTWPTQAAARYLRVTLGIVVEGEEHAKEFAEDDVTRMRLRSSILEMLAEQTADQLTTVEGKAGLKKAIAERAMHGAEHLKVTDVLFSEFIVQ